EIVRHEAPEPVVGCGLLVQRHTDTPDHRAENLAARDLRIEDATGRDRTDHARDADDAKLFVNPDLGEYGRVREMREFTVLIRFDARLFLDPVDLAGPHRVCDRDLPALLASMSDLAIREDHIVKSGLGKRRARYPLCESEKFSLHRPACRVNGAADGGGRERAALDRRI